MLVKHLESDRGKFEVRGWKGIFLGYDQQTGGYRVLDLTSGTVAVTRSVVAQETDFTHMNSFAKEYDPLAPVTNPYVDQNPFELLQEKKDEDTDPDYEPEDEKYLKKKKNSTQYGRIKKRRKNNKKKSIFTFSNKLSERG